MKLFILAIAMLSSVDATARTVYGRGNQATSAFSQRQAQIDAAKRYREYSKSLGQGSGAGTSTDKSGGVLTPPLSSSDGTLVASAAQIDAFRAEFCPAAQPGQIPDEFAQLFIPGSNPQVPSFTGGCIRVACDADLNRNGHYDIEEYAHRTDIQHCTVDNSGFSPNFSLSKSECLTASNRYWVITLSYTGSGYTLSESCYENSDDPRLDRHAGGTYTNSYQTCTSCDLDNAIRDPLCGSRNPGTLCKPNDLSQAEAHNQNTVPNLGGVINGVHGSIHQDCLSAYWTFSNFYIAPQCTHANTAPGATGSITDYACVRNLANLQVGSSLINGVTQTCAEQLDAYFNR